MPWAVQISTQSEPSTCDAARARATVGSKASASIAKMASQERRVS